MTSPIPLARPAVGDAESAAVDRVLRSGRLVLGPENLGFEGALAARIQRSHAVAVSSGTAALELSFWALGVSPGDEVVMPAFGFPAAANAALRLGANPVPADVSAAAWTLDLESASARISGRTKVIVSIDQLGLVADVSAVEALAASHRLGVVNDAACGMGGAAPDGKAGGQGGQVATFSFHARKVVTTGEGGAIATDDNELAARIRRLRNHGQSGRGTFSEVGTNVRLSEMAAAIGRVQMHRLDAMLAERRMLAAGYVQRLEELHRRERLSWQEAGSAVHAYQTFAIKLAAGFERVRVISALADRGIEAGPATYGFHRAFTHLEQAAPLPVADALHERALALPLYIGMRSAELDRVADALQEVLV